MPMFMAEGIVLRIDEAFIGRKSQTALNLAAGIPSSCILKPRNLPIYTVCHSKTLRPKPCARLVVGTSTKGLCCSSLLLYMLATGREVFGQHHFHQRVLGILMLSCSLQRFGLGAWVCKLLATGLASMAVSCCPDYTFKAPCRLLKKVP